MERCERELNALQTAGLEAELLGARVNTISPGEFQRMIRPAEFSKRPSRKYATPRGVYVDPRGVATRGVAEFSMDENDEDAEDDEAEYGGDDYDEDDTAPASPPPAQGGSNDYWKLLADSLDAAHIQSEDQMREYIFQMVMAGKMGKMDPRLRGKFDGLINTVLKESLPFMDLVKQEPSPGPSMRLYGLAMIVIKEYKRLSCLRAHIRQDMLVFVQFYERAAVRNVQRTNRQDKDRYMHFYDYYADVSDLASANHTMGVKMTLRASGVDIMRCMLVAATHLVELIVVLGLCRKIAR